MRLKECDDGNTRNGDGCSSTCTIEKDYRCGGGSEFAPDICIETRKPELQTVTVYKNMTAVLKFSEPVTLNTDTPQNALQLTIMGHMTGKIHLKYDAQQFERKSFNKLVLDLGVNVSLTGYEVLIVYSISRPSKLRWRMRCI
jgi:cysteine-rich repeat protein